MRRTDVAWVAIVGLLIAGTVYEMPFIQGSLRRNFDTLFNAGRTTERGVPDEVAAEDPEAAAILRYRIERTSSEATEADLAALVEKYPENAYLLSEYAVAMARHPLADVLPLVDRLRDMDPNNALFEYLRGYALLAAGGDEKHMTEALQAFARGHNLPRLALPYVKYKSRVDRLAWKAQLNRYGLRTTWRFTWELADTVRKTIHRWSTDRKQRRDLIDSTARIANRLMEDAYDMDSLCDGADLARRVEEIRLKKLDLTKIEAWQARLRLSQAIATDEFSWRWERDCPLTDVSYLSMMPWLMVICVPIYALVSFALKRWMASRSASEKSGHAIAEGLWILTAILVFLAFYQVFEGRSFLAAMVDVIWLMIVFGWFDYARGLGRVAGVDQLPQRRRWIIGFGLLVVNGLALLLIGNSRFLWDRSLAGWADHLGIFGAWLLFCLLLWFATNRSQLAFGRLHRMFAVTLVVSWAGFLLICDVSKNRWHYERRAYAEPLSVCGPLPTATEETYNRVIRDAPPLQYGNTDLHPLPEHVRYMTPADFEALLAKRRAWGSPVTRSQLRELMDDSARDLRPVIEKALEASDAASPSHTSATDPAEGTGA